MSSSSSAATTRAGLSTCGRWRLSTRLPWSNLRRVSSSSPGSSDLSDCGWFGQTCPSRCGTSPVRGRTNRQGNLRRAFASHRCDALDRGCSSRVRPARRGRSASSLVVARLDDLRQASDLQNPALRRPLSSCRQHMSEFFGPVGVGGNRRDVGSACGGLRTRDHSAAGRGRLRAADPGVRAPPRTDWNAATGPDHPDRRGQAALSALKEGLLNGGVSHGREHFVDHGRERLGRIDDGVRRAS
jgi:hypothetical protein